MGRGSVKKKAISTSFHAPSAPHVLLKRRGGIGGINIKAILWERVCEWLLLRPHGTTHHRQNRRGILPLCVVPSPFDGCLKVGHKKNNNTPKRYQLSLSQDAFSCVGIFMLFPSLSLSSSPQQTNCRCLRNGPSPSNPKDYFQVCPAIRLPCS